MEIIKTEMSRKAELYHKAIIELNLTTSGFSFREEDAEILSGFQKKGFNFVTDDEPMSDTQIAEVESTYLELQAEWDAQEYARNRQPEYPSTGDQLDMIYKDTKNSTTTHANAVEAVKTKWPKNNTGPVE